jgi:hypothetical protein
MVSVMDVHEVAWVRRLARDGGARVIRESAGFSASEVARQLGVAPPQLVAGNAGCGSLAVMLRNAGLDSSED